VRWTPSAESGAPVLEEAAAFVECTVLQRMEARDHWVVLAVVTGRSTLSDALTASHHRKTGSYY
jgi:flavin reductase (DIM6/NTAB) family NADH-FMN oxidoreductase RutF